MENPPLTLNVERVLQSRLKDEQIQKLEGQLLLERERCSFLLNDVNALHQELQEWKRKYRKAYPEDKHAAEGGDAKVQKGMVRQMSERLAEPLRTPGGLARYSRCQPRHGVSAEAVDPDSAMKLKVNYVPKDPQTKAKLEDAITKDPMLCTLDARQIREMVDCMIPRDVIVGERVIVEGDEGSAMYISENGKFEVSSRGVVKATFANWHLFGEVALLYGSQRTATVTVVQGKTKTASEDEDEDDGDWGTANIWSLPRSIFQTIMMRTGIQRQQECLGFVRKVPCFAYLADREEELLMLVDNLIEERYSAGEFVFHQGSIGETFYIVREGKVRLLKKSGGKVGEETELQALGPGDSFGEVALLFDDVRTASVKAVEDTVLLAIERRAFMSTFGQSQIPAAASWPPAPPRKIYDLSCDTSEERSDDESTPFSGSGESGKSQMTKDDFRSIGIMAVGKICITVLSDHLLVHVKVVL